MIMCFLKKCAWHLHFLYNDVWLQFSVQTMKNCSRAQSKYKYRKICYPPKDCPPKNITFSENLWQIFNPNILACRTIKNEAWYLKWTLLDENVFSIDALAAMPQVDCVYPAFNQRVIMF